MKRYLDANFLHYIWFECRQGKRLTKVLFSQCARSFDEGWVFFWEILRPHWFRRSHTIQPGYFYSFTATKIPFVKMPKVDGTCKYTGREKAFRTVIKSRTHIRPFQPTKQFHSTCGHILTNFTFQGLHKNLWIAKIRAQALCSCRERKREAHSKKTAVSSEHVLVCKKNRGCGIRLKNTIFTELFTFFTISIKW